MFAGVAVLGATGACAGEGAATAGAAAPNPVSTTAGRVAAARVLEAIRDRPGRLVAVRGALAA
ncbi:hypothetical protein GCM10022377_06770 [Zhihengliuella alba]|uniref:Uncharacterized protein n=1 Tax=Zhihengliuella alba TaxID=547018 RepID=A0ABP7CUQ1_9MICC